MSNSLNVSEREDLRVVVHAYLAGRMGSAFSKEQITPILRRRRSVDFQIEESDVEDALIFLVGQKWAASINSDHGASIFYQATAEGVLNAERRGLC